MPHLLGQRGHMEKTKNIYQKLNTIMGLVSNVPKNGYNSFNKYKFVQESDVADIVREACLAEGVMVIPCVDSYTLTETVTKNGDKSFLTTVNMHFTFVNIDDPKDCTIVHMIGQGQDQQDKGSNKGITGATKYCYLKLFNIGTGDDAEHDSKPDHDYSHARARNTVPVAQPKPVFQTPKQIIGDEPPPHTDDDIPDWMLDSEPPAVLDKQEAEKTYHYKPPFDKKDRAKALGCRWNSEMKTWDSKTQIPEFDAYIK
jgi:hypothetical protein